MSSSLPLAMPPINLPALEQDQTLYSWCGEVHRWNGGSLGVATSARLFGSGRAGFFHDFPSHLGTLVERTGGLIGDAKQLALKHTLLGYYLPFATTRRASEILDGVCHGTIDRLKFHLALPQSGVGASHPLKGCDRCFDEDEEARIHAYWHVEHQWPSIFVCHKHGVPLKFAIDRHTPVHRRDWLLPRSGPLREWVALPPLSEEALEILQKLATHSAALCRHKPASLPPAQLWRAYRSGFRAAGWMRTAEVLAINRIGKAFKQRFACLSALPSMKFIEQFHTLGLQALTRAAEDTVARWHPLKHLLVIELLFGTWSKFEEAFRFSMGGEPIAEIPAASVLVDTPEPKLTQFGSLVRSGLSVSSAARSLGVSTTTGVRWAKVLGLTFKARTKTLSPSLLDVVRGLLREGRPKEEIASTTSISQVSLNRLISSEPDVRQAWLAAQQGATRALHRRRFLELLAQHPGVPLSRIRKLPGNGFQWLYRHDRVWLLENLPAIWQVPGRGDVS